MDITRLEAKIYIEETMLPHVRQGQEVSLDIDGADQSFSGRVSWISPRAEFTPKSILTPDTRTALVYAVEIDIENPDRIMKDGMPVVITL
jgi:HlyD family secretion protein